MRGLMLVLLALGVAVAVFSPLVAPVDARFGEGYGMLANGSAAMVLMFAAFICARVIKRRMQAVEVQA